MKEKNEGKMNEQDGFNQLMALVKDDELKAFAMSYAGKDSNFRNELSEYIRAIYAPKTAKTKKIKAKDYRKEVLNAFDQTTYSSYSRYHQFEETDWDAVFLHIDKLFDEAELLLKAGNASAVLEITTQFFTSLDEDFEESLLYNEDIYVTGYCEQAAQLTTEAIVHPSVSEQEKVGVIATLKKISPHSGMCNYYDFDIEDLILTLTIKTQLDEKALELIDENIRKNSDSYCLYRFVLDKIELLRKIKRDAEAEQVINDYLYMPEIRSLKVDEAVSAKRYDEAIRLLNDGIAIAQKEECKGTEREWMERLLDIYERQKDIPLQVAMCRQLFIHERGSVQYYKKLRQLIPSDDWKEYLGKLIEDTDMRDVRYENDTLASIYIEEADWDKLFEYIKLVKYSRLNTLDQYSCYLPATFHSPLLTMYVEALRLYAAKNLGRDHYERISRAMICMQKMQGGKEQVALLAEEFRITYKNRPAMREVLSRF